MTAERRGLPRTLTPAPAPRPGPCQRRGRLKSRAPLARRPCLLAPRGEGLEQLTGSPECMGKPSEG
ncbi:hypothetical protein CQ393_12635 [Stenotrophomonas sp. MYb238]|nr:hypothetical protein [Stenotrophomonas sp. MYb238]